MSVSAERENVWTLNNSDSWDGAEIVVASTRGGVSIAVTEEKAVDSYNQEFTCTIRLTPTEAEALALFLIRSVAQPLKGE